MHSTADTGNTKTVLGFDVGTKRIGVATGQLITGNAAPLTTLNAINDNPDWPGIKRLIAEWQPQRIIIGLPLHTDGSDSDSSRMVKSFADELSRRFNIPVELHDERLSSAEAESIIRRQRELGQRRRKTQKTDIDKLAAAIIVQSWLNEQAGNQAG